MNRKPTRREMLKHAARGVGLAGLGGAALYLARKAGAHGVWQLDPELCVNSRLGELNVNFCDLCKKECVVPLSAVRAVNLYDRCGRCYLCPAYFDVASKVGADGLPVKKLCPRDAIERKPIGEVDPGDPANNFYEYIIDEELCDGCGKCVMACKEPAGLGSIRLEVRHNLCVDCNRCAISEACPRDALSRRPLKPLDAAPEEKGHG